MRILAIVHSDGSVQLTTNDELIERHVKARSANAVYAFEGRELWNIEDEKRPDARLPAPGTSGRPG